VTTKKKRNKGKEERKSFEKSKPSHLFLGPLASGDRVNHL
jgi:hypothetical protein